MRLSRYTLFITANNSHLTPTIELTQVLMPIIVDTITMSRTDNHRIYIAPEERNCMPFDYDLWLKSIKYTLTHSLTHALSMETVCVITRCFGIFIRQRGNVYTCIHFHWFHPSIHRQHWRLHSLFIRAIIVLHAITKILIYSTIQIEYIQQYTPFHCEPTAIYIHHCSMQCFFDFNYDNVWMRREHWIFSGHHHFLRSFIHSFAGSFFSFYLILSMVGMCVCDSHLHSIVWQEN